MGIQIQGALAWRVLGWQQRTKLEDLGSGSEAFYMLGYPQRTSVSKAEHRHVVCHGGPETLHWENGPVGARVWFCAPHSRPSWPLHTVYMYCAYVQMAGQTSSSSAGRRLTKQQTLIRKTTLQTDGQLETGAQFLNSGHSTVQGMWVSGDTWVSVHVA